MVLEILLYLDTSGNLALLPVIAQHQLQGPHFSPHSNAKANNKGALAHGVSSFPKYFVFASLCSFICLQAVYQLSGPVCKATWNGCPSYSASYLQFTLCD